MLGPGAVDGGDDAFLLTLPQCGDAVEVGVGDQGAELDVVHVAGPPGRGHPPRAPQRVLADQIVDEIRRGIAEGRFTSGDNVTERYSPVGCAPRAPRVHTALGLLADEGLGSIDTVHWPTVPIPTNGDVLELYSARRALGVIAVGATVPRSPADRA